jgi:hypothetical protein
VHAVQAALFTKLPLVQLTGTKVPVELLISTILAVTVPETAVQLPLAVVSPINATNPVLQLAHCTLVAAEAFPR